jgi:5-methylcytosine-specific restriction endonuclease McrA
VPRGRVWVEKIDGKIVKLFRNQGAAAISKAADEGRVAETSRKDAVGEIRKQVFERSGGECEYCGKIVTYQTGHMHEVVPKGKGGDVSLYNCVFICYSCHLGSPNAAHANRRINWTPKPD